ncbi:MAG: hypothetical protein GY817_01095 [bacterium]|nr:hypothetical protein [bacterium]
MDIKYLHLRPRRKHMKIKYTGEYSYTVIANDGKRVTFKQGNNFIDDKVWTNIKNNPLVKDRLNKGVLLLVVTRTNDPDISEQIIEEIKEDTTKPDNKKEVPEKPEALDEDEIENEEINITSLKADEAIEAIKQCLDEQRLKTWQKQATRVTVKDAIKAQLQKLKEIDNV